MPEEALCLDDTQSLDGVWVKKLKPAATHILRQAVERGKIATHEIASFIPSGTEFGREQLSEIMGGINQFLRAHNIKIVTDRDVAAHKKEHPPAQPAKRREPLRRKHADSSSSPREKIELPVELEMLEVEGTNYEHDALGIYYSEVSRYPLLSEEGETELSRRIRDDRDLDARNKLVEHNLRLVRWIARRFTWSNIDFEDLVQEGNIGLMKAADKFDPERGRFSTYASWWIRAAITRAIADQNDTIRKPVHIYELRGRILKAQRELSMNGCEPTFKELAMAVGVSESAVVQLLTTNDGVVSLDKIVDHVGHSNRGTSTQTFGEKLADHGALLPDQVIEAQEELELAKKRVEQLLHEIATGLELSPKYLEVFRMFYGFDASGKRHTLEYVGKQFDVTRERIRQIIAKIWQKVDERGYGMDHNGLLQELFRIDELGKLTSTE